MTPPERPPAILVVDDLPVNRRLMEAILTSHGYEVVQAQSGEEALALLGPGSVAGIVLNAAGHLNHLYDKYASYYDRRK